MERQSLKPSEQGRLSDFPPTKSGAGTEADRHRGALCAGRPRLSARKQRDAETEAEAEAAPAQGSTRDGSARGREVQSFRRKLVSVPFGRSSSSIET